MTLVAGGLICLFAGGEGLVRGAVAVAERLGISRLIVGMVIVGFGTSAPELLVSVRAALAGSPDIAIGNVVGSNIANILLIVGIAALIAPLANRDDGIRRDVIVMLGSFIVLAALMRLGTIDRLAGIGLLALLAVYLLYAIVQESRRETPAYSHEADEMADIPLSVPMGTLAVVAGLLLLVAGAYLLVAGASAIARDLGISEAVIGLTIVAVGTSLPELATAIVAAIRRHADVVLANVVGSNIFNSLCIIGATAAISPIDVAPRFGVFDGFFMVITGVVAAILLFRLREFGRPLGALMVAAYAGYIGLQAI